LGEGILCDTIVSLPKYFFTIGFLLSFLITLLCLQWWQEVMYPAQLWMMLGFSGLLFLFLAILACFIPHVHTSIPILLLVVIFGISLAFLRVTQTTHQSLPSSIESFSSEEEITVHGYITDEPDRRPLSTKYTVEVDHIVPASSTGRRVMLSGARSPAEGEDEAQRRPFAQHDTISVEGRILITDHAQWPRHEYGDEVLVTGVLERPEKIEDFYYDRYLSRYGIYSVMYRSDIQTLSPGHASSPLSTSGYSFFSYLYSLKQRFESQINRLFPEPHASFLAGLLTGSRRGIPEHLLADFRATGLTHIIAISGYNVSIVIVVITGALFFLPLKWRFLPALVAITSFTFFVGASPSVVRATIMGGLGLFALQAGRERHSFIAILLAAFLMTVWNPKILWYDAGFQLSFLAVLGLNFLAPQLDRWCASIPHTFGLRESLQMTIAAQLAAVPLIVVLFGQFSLVAPVANVLVAPFIPLAMLFGFLAVCISFVSFPLGQFVAFLGWAALEFIIMIAQHLAALPFALLSVTQAAHWMVWGYYSVLIILLFLPLIHKHTGSLFLWRTQQMPRGQ
jgi:competence protein ComEC